METLHETPLSLAVGPTLAERKEEVDLEIKRDEWKLCCSSSSGVLVRYIGQMFVCGIILIFSFYQIIENPGEDNSVYFSLISGIVGYILPSPTLGMAGDKHG